MEGKHTSGPWRVEADAYVFGTGEVMICQMRGHGHCRSQGMTDEEEIVWQKTNANLIAAAPELLASLEAVVAEVCQCAECEPPDHPSGCDNLVRARAAIAKARGEKQ